MTWGCSDSSLAAPADPLTGRTSGQGLQRPLRVDPTGRVEHRQYRRIGQPFAKVAGAPSDLAHHEPPVHLLGKPDRLRRLGSQRSSWVADAVLQAITDDVTCDLEP